MQVTQIEQHKSLKLYEMQTIVQFLCLFIEGSNEYMNDFILKIQTEKESSWNCLQKLLLNTSFSSSPDLCERILNALVPDASSLSSNQKIQRRISWLQALLDSSRDNEGQQRGRQGENLVGEYIYTRNLIVKMLLDNLPVTSQSLTTV